MPDTRPLADHAWMPGMGTPAIIAGLSLRAVSSDSRLA
jgi:hypothetical protein